MGGTLIPAVPGTEASVVAGLAHDTDVAVESGTVILVGERMATVPGALSAVVDLAATTGAKLAWVPRRAGDRGAVEAGALPNLLPGGRPVADGTARTELAARWGVDTLPEAPGRDGDEIIATAAEKRKKTKKRRGLVVGGVDPADLSDPALALQAFKRAFTVSLEVRESAVTRVADVVLPVAPVTDKDGMFVTWEGRVRPFPRVLDNPSSLPDVRVLAGIAEELGTPLGFRTPAGARAEMERLGPWQGDRPAANPVAAPKATRRKKAELVLASHKQMLDDGRMQDGDEHLRATARPPVVLVGKDQLGALGVEEGDEVTLTGELGSVTLPVGVADVADGVVWAPASAPGASVRHRVGPAGSIVSLSVTAQAVTSQGGKA
jgi:NADH-quinone oxidoreductase subunit G